MHQLDAADALGGTGQRPVAGRLPSAERGRPDHRRRQRAGRPRTSRASAAFECYAQLVAKDDRAAVVQRAHAAADASRSAIPTVVRAASRETYGTPREEIDAELQALIFGSEPSAEDDLGPRRRDDGERPMSRCRVASRIASRAPGPFRLYPTCIALHPCGESLSFPAPSFSFFTARSSRPCQPSPAAICRRRGARRRRGGRACCLGLRGRSWPSRRVEPDAATNTSHLTLLVTNGDFLGDAS